MFLDCRRCDQNHFRREAPFLDYVRDRQDADVHVLVTDQRTGSGTVFIFEFIGLRANAGSADTLRASVSDTDTQAERRDAQVRTFLFGLYPFVAQSPAARRLRVRYDAPDAPVQPQDDPWNFWVFEVSAGGFWSKESRQQDISVNGGLEADRVTEDWKFEFEASGRYSEDRFEITEDSTVIDTRRNFDIEADLVRSVGLEHWAIGASSAASASTFENQDFEFRFGLAGEFSIFPYSESTRRALTMRYTVGFSHFNYEEVTIFDRTQETRPNHDFSVRYQLVQPWGNVNVNATARSFLHDLSLHRLSIGGNINLRLVRGLNFRTFGNVARIKDQIFLSGADIPPEEILLRRRQLGTDFRIFLSIGLSYRFGSIFNNVVNPRM